MEEEIEWKRRERERMGEGGRGGGNGGREGRENSWRKKLHNPNLYENNSQALPVNITNNTVV